MSVPPAGRGKSRCPVGRRSISIISYIHYIQYPLYPISIISNIHYIQYPLYPISIISNIHYIQYGYNGAKNEHGAKYNVETLHASQNTNSLKK